MAISKEKIFSSFNFDGTVKHVLRAHLWDKEIAALYF
jgi:hypothetical protein